MLIWFSYLKLIKTVSRIDCYNLHRFNFEVCFSPLMYSFHSLIPQLWCRMEYRIPGLWIKEEEVGVGLGWRGATAVSIYPTAVPRWPPHEMANPSKKCSLACVKREASRWKMSLSTFKGRTRWVLSCPVSHISHSFKSRSCSSIVRHCTAVLQQAVWERWLPSSCSNILSNSHAFFSFVKVCETYFKELPVEVT